MGKSFRKKQRSKIPASVLGSFCSMIHLGRIRLALPCQSFCFCHIHKCVHKADKSIRYQVKTDSVSWNIKVSSLWFLFQYSGQHSSVESIWSRKKIRPAYFPVLPIRLRLCKMVWWNINIFDVIVKSPDGLLKIRRKLQKEYTRLYLIQGNSKGMISK